MDTTDETLKAIYTTIWQAIQEELVNMKDGEDISFDDFLQKLNITEEDCILGIRASISTTTVFLKRTLLQIHINIYNAVCLEAWKAKMDLQFIIDVYACAIYIASYLTKAQRGISELLRNACKEVNKGNKTIKEQVRIIGEKVPEYVANHLAVVSTIHMIITPQFLKHLMMK